MNDSNDRTGESAADVYERIRQRRHRDVPAGERTEAPQVAPRVGTPAGAPVAERRPSPEAPQADALQIDELLDRPRPIASSADPDPARPGAMTDQPTDRFPRSRTMKFILENPGVALAVGVPAALLVAASPASRRLIATAVRIGVQPEVRQLVRLSASAFGPPRPRVERRRMP